MGLFQDIFSKKENNKTSDEKSNGRKKDDSKASNYDQRQDNSGRYQYDSGETSDPYYRGE